MLALFALPGSGWAQQQTAQKSVAVIYPKVREPFDRVFNDIIQGISQPQPEAIKEKINILLYQLNSDSKQEKLSTWLKQKNPSAIIALGISGQNQVLLLKPTQPVVIGAVKTLQSLPPVYQGIAFSPDPKVLFNRVKHLAPFVKNIAVVYHPKHNADLINRALSMAQSADLVLQTYPATKQREAAKKYRAILPTLPRHSAIWITYDQLDRSVLADILSVAWQRQLVVFSSTSSHVKAGALFSLYPNNIVLGRKLVETALGINDKNSSNFLQDVYTAVNLRTATHLGLKLEKNKDYDLSFPSR
ncbi:MAG: ABC transporter substrate binding protein [Pseudomonadales bacterium]